MELKINFCAVLYSYLWVIILSVFSEQVTTICRHPLPFFFQFTVNLNQINVLLFLNLNMILGIVCISTNLRQYTQLIKTKQ